jgi:DNA-binding SARP family transcriptional activator/tetratricopeptide (TPR) repeat protein
VEMSYQRGGLALEDDGMECRLLGPVELRTAEGPIAIPGRKPRTLLAALLLEPGHTVSTSRLIDVIWDDKPPDTARALIQTYVSGLRRAVNGRMPDLIETRYPGYRARVPVDRLDRHAFETLVAQGRVAVAEGRYQAAADVFRAADALWRGPALGGVTGKTLAAEAARLDELRIAVLEERIDADLALGRYGLLTGELSVLVRAHPTRERLRGQLMLALYGSGRATEALTVYREGRRALIDELGIEPGPELSQLHERILRSDSDLLTVTPPGRLTVRVPDHGDLVAAQARPAGPMDTANHPGTRLVPAQLPSDPADFTGREPELGQLVELFTGPRRGSTVCVVAGPGGVGKSALAVHVAHQLAAEFPDGQLYVDLHGLGPSPPPPIELLGRFLRGLGDNPATLPDSLDERVDRYRTHLADRRILVVLDDAASESQVRPLLPGGHSSAVLITSRSRLPGLAGAHLIELGMLSPAEATALLTRIAGEQRIRSAPEAATQIITQCGFLPLAVRIAGARLATRRHWSPQLLAARLADEQQRLDELRVGDQQVRSAVELSYSALPEAAQVVLRRLGRLGVRDFPLWLAAALVDVPLDTAELLVEQLVDAHLLEYSYVDSVGQVRYRLHDLVRIYAREQADAQEPRAEEVAATSRVVGTWLALVEQLADLVPPGTFRYQPRSSVTCPVYPEVIELALANPRAWLETEQNALVRCVERAAELGLDELVVALASALCSSLYLAYNMLDGWGRTHRAALAAARNAGNAEGEAILLAGLGQLRFEQDRFAEAREYLSNALAMFRDAGHFRGEAATLAALGTACREQGYLPEATHFLAKATAASQTLGDDNAIGHCARITGSVRLEQGDFAAARAALEVSLAAYRRAGSRRGEALTLRTAALEQRARGDLAAAERTCAAALAIFTELGDELLVAYCLRTLAKIRFRRGYVDEPLAQLLDALDTCRKAGDRWGEGLTLRTLGELHLTAGRLDEAEQHFDAAMRIWDALDVPLFRARTLRDIALMCEARGAAAAATLARAEAVEIFRVHGAREFAELSGGL